MVGLGNLMKDCPTCNGIGWIDEPNEELKVTLKDAMVVTKKKKKKVNNETILQC